MSTGAIAHYVLVAARGGELAPILSDAREVADTDSISQAAIFTAIAIGFSIQALILMGAIELARDNPTLESHEIEKNHMP